MHWLLRLPYAALGATAELAATLTPDSHGKLARTLRARRGIAARFRAFTAQRDPARPLVWFHAPSVGESLQALPVLERVRASAASPQAAVTWFSPSAEAFALRFDADFRDYLPFDTVRGARAALDALRPTALVFSKLDVWPVLTREAAARGVRVGLISGTVREGSGRLSAVARAVLRDAYARLDLVGAIGDADAERLQSLGVPARAIRVTGDTRYDQAWEHAQRLDRSRSAFAALASTRPTLVAGSTWPPDEAVLTTAWDALRAAVPDARLMIAPHEPTATHLEPLRAWAAQRGLRTAALGGAGIAEADVILVDTVGVLGDLYAFGDVAFVGGGFHAPGLHSVLEPAAHGRAVLFGPGGAVNPDASGLEAAQGAGMVRDAAGLSSLLRRWLGNARECRAAGDAAAGVVRSGVGAADRAAGLVGELLAGRAVQSESGPPRGLIENPVANG
jgi:3-deoxy-D-manno-octulosonic-acid transferase